MGKVIATSPGPQPYPGVPTREPARPQQPGEELIKYDLEVGSCCELSTSGWLCFAALVCTPFSCLPFCLDRCHKTYQRPVYGYPMGTSAFLEMANSPSPAPHGSGPGLAPVVCLADADASTAGLSSTGDSPSVTAIDGADEPPVPPCSIFIPPSAVPSTGFPSGSPLPRYPSPSPNQHLSGTSPANSPRAAAYLAPSNSSMTGGTSQLGYPSPTARWQQQQATLDAAYQHRKHQQERELQELNSPRSRPTTPGRLGDQKQQQQQQQEQEQQAPAAERRSGSGPLPAPAFVTSSKLAAIRTIAAVDQALGTSPKGTAAFNVGSP